MNPTLTSFLKKHKEITLIGFAWAIWWRMLVVIYGTLALVGLFLLLLGS